MCKKDRLLLEAYESEGLIEEQIVNNLRQMFKRLKYIRTSRMLNFHNNNVCHKK